MKLLCECPASKHTLRYRYTMEELKGMLLQLEGRVETFNTWANKLRQIRKLEGDDRLCTLRYIL